MIKNKNKISIYGFYENDKNKDCCVYKVNLEDYVKFVLCNNHGNVISIFYSKTKLYLYLNEKGYKKLHWALDVWLSED